MKLLRLNNFLTVVFDDGTTKTIPDCAEELYNRLLKCTSDEAKALLDPAARIAPYNNLISKSKIITQKGMSAYIESISQLTVPQDLVTEILKAESEGDIKTLNSYLNFWTLVSLNPDSRVRNNIFWFLKRWNIKITESGLIVAYRNVDIKKDEGKYNHLLIEFVSVKRSHIKHVTKKSPKSYYVYTDQNGDYFISSVCNSDQSNYVGNLEELYQDIIAEDSKDDVTVYTDHHTHTFEIRLGHIVQMSRDQVDCNQDVTCSRGLHCAGKDWLKRNYFGSVGMRVLINPAEICAIPHEDNYGKLRTCAYYPLDIIEFDDNGNIIEEAIDTGMEDDFLHKICYKGEVNNEDNDNYKLVIPTCSEIDQYKIDQNLINIAKRINRFI